jgi:hypothetical protein
MRRFPTINGIQPLSEASGQAPNAIKNLPKRHAYPRGHGANRTRTVANRALMTRQAVAPDELPDPSVVTI